MDPKGGCCLDKLRDKEVDISKRATYKRNCRTWNPYNVFKLQIRFFSTGNSGVLVNVSSLNIGKIGCYQTMESSKYQFDKCGLYFIFTREPLEILK